MTQGYFNVGAEHKSRHAWQVLKMVDPFGIPLLEHLKHFTLLKQILPDETAPRNQMIQINNTHQARMLGRPMLL